MGERRASGEVVGRGPLRGEPSAKPDGGPQPPWLTGPGQVCLCRVTQIAARQCYTAGGGQLRGGRRCLQRWGPQPPARPCAPGSPPAGDAGRGAEGEILTGGTGQIDAVQPDAERSAGRPARAQNRPGGGAIKRPGGPQSPRGGSQPPPKPRSGRAGGDPAGPREAQGRCPSAGRATDREPAPKRGGGRAQRGQRAAPEGVSPQRGPSGRAGGEGPRGGWRAGRAEADPRRGRGPGASGDAECA